MYAQKSIHFLVSTLKIVMIFVSIFWNKKWLLSWKIFIVGCQKLKWDLVKIKAPLWTNMSLAPSMGTHQAACLCKPLRLPHSSSADERYRKIRLAVQSMPYYSRTYLKNIKKNGINTLAHFLQLKSKPLRFRSDLQNIAQCHKKH